MSIRRKAGTTNTRSMCHSCQSCNPSPDNPHPTCHGGDHSKQSIFFLRGSSQLKPSEWKASNGLTLIAPLEQAKRYIFKAWSTHRQPSRKLMEPCSCHLNSHACRLYRSPFRGTLNTNASKAGACVQAVPWKNAPKSRTGGGQNSRKPREACL